MDERISKKLYDDVMDFTGKESGEWYEQHSIPYKRGYLLYGPPGTGKTSTISALASLLKRNVCRINLVANRLTDDSLHCAITNVRENSIVVMEDVDCLFGKMREKKEEFHVTFSGFLNAIDGLQCAKGLLHQTIQIASTPLFEEKDELMWNWRLVCAQLHKSRKCFIDFIQMLLQKLSKSLLLTS